jgi:hypothetical protein
MKINGRQEIAMWVLGLLWSGIGFLSLRGSDEWGLVQAALILLVLLVPVGLVVFSLRDRKKPD